MTPEQIDVLRTEMQDAKYADKTPREIARMLVEYPMIANPEPAPQIPKPITGAAVRQLLSQVTVTPEEKAELVRAVMGDNRGALAKWADLCLDDPALVHNYLAQTIADPTHPAEVRGLTRAEEIGLADVEDAEGRKYHLWGMRPYVEQILAE